MELSRAQFRIMIFYDFKAGLDFHQSYERLAKAFEDQAPSLDTVRRWMKEFQRGRQSFNDEPHPRRPTEAVTPENIRLVEKLIRQNRNITVREIQEEVGIGLASIERILHEHLQVHKLASRWIPHLLSQEQKDERVEWCNFMLNKFDQGRSKRVNEIVTHDQTWIFCYLPETKQQSMVWVFDDEPPPTKVVRDKSVKKQMVDVFFRRTDVVAVVPLQQGRTVTAAWFTEVALPAAFKRLQEERPRAGLRGILLHQDNAPAHTAAKTIDFLHDSGVQLLPHPPHSPDLAPSDFFLFPEAKKRLRGKRFESVDGAIAAFRDVLDDIPKSEFQKCFDKWFWRMDECIRARGEYFEKI